MDEKLRPLLSDIEWSYSIHIWIIILVFVQGRDYHIYPKAVMYVYVQTYTYIWHIMGYFGEGMDIKQCIYVHVNII